MSAPTHSFFPGSSSELTSAVGQGNPLVSLVVMAKHIGPSIAVEVSNKKLASFVCAPTHGFIPVGTREVRWSRTYSFKNKIKMSHISGRDILYATCLSIYALFLLNLVEAQILFRNIGYFGNRFAVKQLV
jgi:hypothetical protein